ncbi:nucleotidyl transferase AbiEii/AbiGii toxin family protein [Pelagibacterium luteolum]|uniref:Nucleotidyl transferase AbiEii toxin, Type IV TA system n=1 Tax=Pelagibacterium luteolum TaxID=440168 RepID=A0A1G7XHX3_9HYPH|nr:nucleotidyl transferase AbiEii/AbiGii toxin family protein [Pelagibacterium luteolum]SDG83726.1 Nucleotidyl transferase AbiEii toxin, Type IV TA system [Pelagibacterium luteolum]
MSRTNKALVTPAGLSSFAKLKAAAAKAGRPADQITHRFALEGAIRRIFESEHADRFGMTSSLKGGAIMFFSEGVEPMMGRHTTDVDIQISGFDGTLDDFADIMREVLASVPATDDGVRFDLDTLKVLGTRETGIPGGAIVCQAQIGTAIFKFKCDVGFYDESLKESLVAVDLPSLLPGMPPIRILRQPVEYSIADKVHAAVRHAGTNTRLRDFYDLYVYVTRCPINQDRLRHAFEHTFALFGDELPDGVEDIITYGPDFVAANADQWRSVRDSSRWAVQVPDLAEVVEVIKQGIAPVLGAGSLHRPAA